MGANQKPRYLEYEGIFTNKKRVQSENRMFFLKETYIKITIQDGSKNIIKNLQKILTAKWKFFNHFDQIITFGNKSIEVKYKDFILAKKSGVSMELLHLDIIYNGEKKDIKLPKQNGFKRSVEFKDGVVVTLEYAPTIITLPFAIKLRDFQLDRYPGSMAPSSYASEVTVIKSDGTSYDYRIYMNHTLQVDNYLFFQSSYFPDESGTILSVNNDPGKCQHILDIFYYSWNDS